VTDMKDRRARRDTADTLRSDLARSHADRPYIPPQRVLDEIAERALTGGYDVSNQCPVCFTARSCGGTCLCQ
jgi:hypothetical protein